MSISLLNYLDTSKEPNTSYECFVAGLILVATADSMEDFESAKELVMEFSSLLSNKDINKAIDFVESLEKTPIKN